MFSAIISSFILFIASNSPITEVFEKVYETGIWGVDENQKGTSGSGSEPRNALPYINYLTKFLKEKNITSVVDAGCGDWQFSRNLDWTGISYTGIDASKTVVTTNLEKFAKDNINFIHANFIDMNLPKADLLILKDVLQHLSIANVHKAIKQFKKFKYVIVVNDIDPNTQTSKNREIADGDYRTLDITAKPFGVKAKRVLTYKPEFSYETKLVLLVDNSK